MTDVKIHPTIAAKYDVTKGFVQKLSIPGIGFRDLAITPLHVVVKKIEAGIIPGLVEKADNSAEVESTEGTGEAADTAADTAKVSAKKKVLTKK